MRSPFPQKSAPSAPSPRPYLLYIEANCTMNANEFIEFDRLPFYQQRYTPSPVSKSPGIKKIQQKWEVKDDLLKHMRKLDLTNDATESPSRTKPKLPSYKQDRTPASSPRSTKPSLFQQSSPKRIELTPKKSQNSPYRAEPSNQNNVAVTTNALKNLPLPLKNVSTHSLNASSSHSAVPVSPSTPKKAHKYNVQRVYNDPDVQWVRATYMGRTYRFVRPARSFVNHDAAKQIQRIIRGGMQRLHYKIQRLQHLLDTRKDRTDAAIAAIHKSNEKRKQNLRAKLNEKVKKGQRRIEQTQVTVDESLKVIEYVRRENKKLRESNQKIFTAMEVLKHENARIENANTETDDSLVSIAKHAETIEETHAKLMEVVPQFKAKVDEMEEALEQRNRYHDFERKIKIMYLKLMGKIAEKFEDNFAESELADEIVSKCLEMEERELDTFGASCNNFDSSYGRMSESSSKINCSESKMKSLGEHFQVADASDHADEDEEIDAYTVHTMD